MDTDQKITRRDLLTRGAGAVVAAGAAAGGAYLLYDPTGEKGLSDAAGAAPELGNYFEDVDFPASNPRISVATSHDGNCERMVRAAVEGLAPSRGMGLFISRGDVVLIKPNVGFDRAPQLGATTNPLVVGNLVRLCIEAGADQVLVADNPIESPEACFAKSRIGPEAEAQGARIVLPTRAFFENLIVRDRPPDRSKGEALGRWSVFHRPLAEATKIIGVAPVKDHNLCGASMNLKNWYGLLGGRRNQFHQAIHEIVSDLGMMFSPTMVIADATRVMMRNGPTGGRASDVKTGGELGRSAIVASVDPVACDAWCYRHLLGRDPATLAYLQMTQEKIATRIAQGDKRFGQRDWQAYDRQGLIVTTDV